MKSSGLGLNFAASVALGFAAVSSFAAAGDGLAVSLSAPAPVLRGDVDVTLNVSVTNTTRQPMAVLRWELPSSQPDGALFRVLRDGQPVGYTGRLVKRAAPTNDDYVRIEPGATLNYEVELTAAYDLSRSGAYSIEYIGKGGQRGPVGREAQSAVSAVQGATSATGTAPSSNTLYLWLESRSAPAALSSSAGSEPPSVSAGAKPNVSPLAASIAFTGSCSASRKTALSQAVAAATTYANGAVSYLDGTPAPTQRYTKWFGAETSARWNTAASHYANVADALTNKPLTLDCSCTDSVYAYVYPTQPYKIYLCSAFWSAPATGTDSKAGTLIHEMTHFNAVASTDDWAYGQSAAARLAVSNPTRALDNADSHEYFAENAPSLP